MSSNRLNRTETDPSIPIKYEDKDLLVIYKPSGLLSQKDKSEDPDVHTLVRTHLAHQAESSQNIDLIHRLDRPVSGLMVLGKNKNVTRALSRQFKEGTIQKTYWAVVKGPPPKNGVLTDYLYKEEEKNKVFVVSEESKGGKYAELAFQLLEIREGISLLEIHPITGRSHQIRVQLAEEGFPILGDQKYGGATISTPNAHYIALHAQRLAFEHSGINKQLELTVRPPTHYPWNQFTTIQQSQKTK